MEISRQENVTPVEAALSLVRVAMGRAAYVDSVLTDIMDKHIAAGGSHLDPPDSIKPWLRESRQERLLAAKTAQAAVNAGVMEVLARRTSLEGSLVADAVAAALDSLELDTDDRVKALGAAQERLLSAE